ncbi:MAG TPA: hypothetical protein VGD88_03515 [Opitutaceae bacterium]
MNRLSAFLARICGNWPFPFSVGVAVLFAAMGLRQIAALGTDAPSGSDWLADGVGLFLPWIEQSGGVFSPASWLVQDANAGDGLLKVGLLVMNGQWDPRLAFMAGVGFLAGAWAVILTWILPAHRAIIGLALGLSGLVVALVPAAVAAVASPAAPLNAAVALASLLYLRWSVSGRRGWIGAVAGLVAVALSTAGLASVAAVLVVEIFVRVRNPSRGAPKRFLVWNGVLLIGGLARAGWSAEAIGQRGFAWDHAPVLAVAAALAALVWGLASAVRRRGADTDKHQALVLLGLWACLIAGLRSDLSALWPLIVVIALATVISELSHVSASRARVAWLGAGFWLLVAVQSVNLSSASLAPQVEQTRKGQERARATRLAVARSDVTGLGPALGLTESEVVRIRPLLLGSDFRPWLPAAVRHPLKLQAQADVPGFAADGAPPLPALPPGSTVIGTWDASLASGAGTPGEWVSAEATTQFPLLQFHVAGRLARPDTRLWLTGQDGEEREPLQARLDATGGWRRTNLEVTPGPFRVQLRDESAENWIAMTAPIELGRGTWLAGKSADLWPWLFGFGGMVVTGAVLLGWSAACREEPSWATLRWVPWLGVALYAVVLSARLDSSAAGSDAAGYLGSAQLLTEGKLTVAAREIPGVSLPAWAYAPLGFSPREQGGLAPTYPTGLPLMIAALQQILPRGVAVEAISLLHLVAGVCLVYALARLCGLRAGWAWLGAGLIGLGPIYLYNGVQPLSDVASLAWVSFALCCGLRSRDGSRWTLAAGATVAMAVLLRPTNALIIPAVAILLPSWRSVPVFLAGALPGAIWQCTHAWLTYGHPLATGYGDISGAFEWRWLPLTLPHYGWYLTGLVSPAVWLALLSPWFSGLEPRIRRALSLIAFGYFALYAFYFCTHETWWYLRFILPALPAVIVLALRVGQTVTDKLQMNGHTLHHARYGPVLAVALVALPLVQSHRFNALEPARGNRLYREIAQEVQTSTADGAIVMALQASGTLHLSTDRVVLRFDQLTRDENTRAAARALALGRPVYAVLFGFDRTAAGDRLPAGDWELQRSWGDVELRRLTALAMPDGAER